ncbi:NUDIX hydrolase [Halobacillus campisalis]|uniref:NUDIX hydrolase n=1 Tax=Halobacillus campisalis TaxID=435909 RepID=A0ABW2K7I9_9BACI|nr:NUDIX domain-containing protein [Halobacillus campisalis]
MGYVEDLRKLVGKRPLILVGSVVVIVNEQGDILLQQRTFPKEVWGLPGGLMELGETTEEAAEREVFEETRLRINQLKLINIYSGKEYYTVAENGDEFYSVTTAYYTATYEGELIANQEEAYDCRFISADNLPDKMIRSHKRIIEDYLKNHVVK